MVLRGDVGNGDLAVFADGTRGGDCGTGSMKSPFFFSSAGREDAKKSAGFFDIRGMLRYLMPDRMV